MYVYIYILYIHIEREIYTLAFSNICTLLLPSSCTLPVALRLRIQRFQRWKEWK